MSVWQIILGHLVFLTGCQPLSGPQFAPAAQPVAAPIPYPTTSGPQPALLPAGPPYLESSPAIIQPAPPMAPIYPPQSTVVPGTGDPNHFVVPGSRLPNQVPGLANPIAVPVLDEEMAWDQIVDVVSDYFTVAREQRARRGGDLWSEGRIDTAPQDGATWLEPHRRDSVGDFNRWESTFQTIRRRAIVRVIPDTAGYLVEVVVEKELEDLPKPEKATAGAATFRNDGSLPSRRLEKVDRTRSSPRWIQLGRDPPLEQRILADIHARLSGVAAGPASVFAQ